MAIELRPDTSFLLAIVSPSSEAPSVLYAQLAQLGFVQLGEVTAPDAAILDLARDQLDHMRALYGGAYVVRAVHGLYTNVAEPILPNELGASVIVAAMPWDAATAPENQGPTPIRLIGWGVAIVGLGVLARWAWKR